MNTERIFIKLIDGTECWIPVSTRQIDHYQFVILDDPAFDNLDTTLLFEFYPGDTIKIGQQTLSDGTTGLVAKELISASIRPDRKYWGFMFLAAVDKMPIEPETAHKYSQEIERIKKEKASGQFFYPKVLDIVNQLDRLV